MEQSVYYTQVDGQDAMIIADGSTIGGGDDTDAEDTLARVVNFLQMEGHQNLMTEDGNTIIIQQGQQYVVQQEQFDPLAEDVISISVNTGNKVPPTKRGHNGLPSVSVSTPSVSATNSDRIVISTTTGRERTPAQFFKCDRCETLFVQADVLAKHEAHCDGAKPSPKGGSRMGGVSFDCVFCDAEFSDKPSLMEHLKGCSKARRIPAPSSRGRKSVPYFQRGDVSHGSGDSSGGERDSDEDTISDGQINYDDDEDLEMFGGADEDLERTMDRKSQKHLGPILTGGKYKCRDCDRTFSREPQYKRHIRACTNAPLNASRIDTGVFASYSPDPKRTKISLPPTMRGRRGRRPRSFMLAASTQSRQQTDEHDDSFESIEDSLMETDRPDRSVKLEPGEGAESSFVDSDFLNLGAEEDEEMDEESKFSATELSEGLPPPTSSSLVTKSVGSNTVKCGICEAVFSHRKPLQDHVRAHAKDISNMRSILRGEGTMDTDTCAHCGLHFISLHLLTHHMVTVHRRELQKAYKELARATRRLVCPFCPVSRPTEQLYLEHLAIKHHDEVSRVPFSASEMPPKKEPLAHSGNSEASTAGPVFRCHICSSTFGSQMALNQHRDAGRCVEQTVFCCRERDCSLMFSKMKQLTGHLEQEHSKSLVCKWLIFGSLQEFQTWVRREENKIGVQYVSKVKRIQGTRMQASWVCEYVVNKEKAGSAHDEPGKNCYSMILAETDKDPATQSFTGRTHVTYYPYHEHLRTPQPGLEPFSMAKTTGQSYSSVNRGFSSAGRPRGGRRGRPPLSRRADTNYSSPTPTRGSGVRGGYSVVPLARSPRQPRGRGRGNFVASAGTNAYKTTSQIEVLHQVTPKETLQEGMMLTGEDGQSAFMLVDPNGASDEVLTGDGGSDGVQNEEEGGSAEETYILPADTSEWQKLFEVVQGRLDMGTLEENERAEAEGIMPYQNCIPETPIEEQVVIFNRLCVLADVQVEHSG